MACLPWCVLGMLCNTTQVNIMPLATISPCSMVPSSTVKRLRRFQSCFQKASCLWRYFSWLFFLTLSVAFCCRVCPSMASRQTSRQPARSSASLAQPHPGVQVPEAPSCYPQSSPFSLPSKICASEQEPLDPQYIHRNRHSASIRARRIRKKKPL